MLTRVFLIILLCPLYPLTGWATPTEETEETEERSFYSASFIASSYSLSVEENNTNLEISSQSRFSFGLSGRFEYRINERVTINIGLSYQSLALNLAQKTGNGFEAEFLGRGSYIGVPIGLRLKHPSIRKLYGALSFAVNSKLSSSTSVVRCTGLCSEDAEMVDVYQNIDFGIGLETKRWDFEVLYSRSSKDHYEGPLTDYRLEGLRFIAGYRF